MSSAFRVGFCVSGEGRLFRAATELRHQLGIEPALLVASPRASSQLESFCAANDVPCVRITAHAEAFNRDLTHACIAAQLNLLCLTFDRILPSELVEHYHKRSINTHLSLLPAFKGLHPLADALAAGVRVVGATIHEVEVDVDAGAPIAQCVVASHRGDTVESLGQRVFALLRPMYLQVIAWYAAGRVEHDQQGGVWVRDAIYGRLPWSPAIEPPWIPPTGPPSC